MNTTYDLFKAEIDKTSEESRVAYETLDRKFNEMQENLRVVNSELSDTQEKLDSERTAWEIAEKSKNEIVNKSRINEAEMSLRVHEAVEDLKRQAAIAREAQENYEREVVAHSATIKSLSTIKESFAKIKEENVSALVSFK